MTFFLDAVLVLSAVIMLSLFAATVVSVLGDR